MESGVHRISDISQLFVLMSAPHNELYDLRMGR